MVWTQEREARDLARGMDLVTRRERTMALIHEMASSLVPGIYFTTDLPSNHQTNKVPILDTQVWTETSAQGSGTKIRHKFYEEQVTSPLVFPNRGACPTKQKMIVLAEETRHRLYN